MFKRAEIERWKKLQEADKVERKRRRQLHKKYKKEIVLKEPDYEWIQRVPKFLILENGNISYTKQIDGSVKYITKNADFLGFVELQGKDFYGITKEEENKDGKEIRESDTSRQDNSGKFGMGNIKSNNLRLEKTGSPVFKIGK